MEAIIQTEKLSHIYSAGTPFEHGAQVDLDFTASRGENLLSHISASSAGRVPASPL